MPGFVFAYDWLFMVARHIVPFDSVSIEVVEDSHAGLLLTTLPVFSVVRLSHSVPSSMGPIMELVAIGWGHFHLVRRPEPTVDQFWEKLRLVATVEIALPSRRPEKGHPAVNEALDPVILLACLKGDKIHAALPAVVPGIEPVPLVIPNLLTSFSGEQLLLTFLEKICLFTFTFASSSSQLK